MSRVGGPTMLRNPQLVQQNLQTQETGTHDAQTQNSGQTTSESGGNQRVSTNQERRSRIAERQFEGQAREINVRTQLGSPQHDRMAPGREDVQRILREQQQHPAVGPQRQGALTNLDGTERTTRAPQTPETTDVTQDPSFRALPEATRNRLAQSISTNPQTSSQLQQVMYHSLYNDLSTEQRTRLLNVFANSDARGRESLPTLMERRVVVGTGDPPPTTPALLSGDNTRNRTTLLENLDRLATQPMQSGLANRQGEVLGRVIQETAEPTWRVDQGITGTCVGTSIQHHLLRHTPSEYARIIGGLSSPDRSVTLANLSRMHAAINDTALPATVTMPWGNPPVPTTLNDPRSVTERMFQSAVQQYGARLQRGPDYQFNADTNRTGLWDNQTAHVMRGIYNRDYSFHPAGARGISNATADPTEQADMRQQLARNVRSEIQSGQGPVPVHLVWGSHGHGLHEVSVERVENGRVYFRNPWGSRDPGSGQLIANPNYHDGQRISDPPRRVEDSQSGLESMTLEDFRRRLNGATLGPPVGG
ncbi:hypothetical protein L0244_32505 [bacterium]|nr:hypothetical protein [bacterium]